MFQRYTRLWLVLYMVISLPSHAQAGAFNLEDWPNTQASLKPMYVKAIMEQAGVHMVSFKLPADFYIDELDKFAAFAAGKKYQPWLKTSVAQNLATMAIIHCDWNNGVPPWEFAQKYLGAAQIELLTPRYAAAIARLQNNCAPD
jgi:hypothetical protein